MNKSESVNYKKFTSWLNNGNITKSAYDVLMSQNFFVAKESKCNDTKQLKISVAISTYRRSALLIRLLDSIRSQIYDNIEIVVVDDCSKDETESVIKQYMTANAALQIKFLVNEKNKGVGPTKKRAFLQCTGDIIIFSDDDDYYIDNTYFSTLNQIYSNNPECVMTIAGSIKHYEMEDAYYLHEINFDHPITTVDYLNGFAYKYTKPNSLFPMSVSSKNANAVTLERLLYFNDTSLYLISLLGDGMVFPIHHAVGIYYMNGKNMTGNNRADYIVANLEAKEDIYNRALEKRLLVSPKQWHYRNITITSSHYLIGNKNVEPEEYEVWKWIKEHFPLRVYYYYVLRVVIARIRRGKSVNFRYIKF